MPCGRPQRMLVLAAAGVASALVASAGVASSQDNEPPAAVFKTRPRADGSVISGRGPLDVTFNMCPTSDTDRGDQLKFTYDFDGDGVIDYYGHCRQTHRYPPSTQCVDAVVCVTDRQPGHQECRSYAVCAGPVSPGKPPGPSPSPNPGPTPSPNPSPSAPSDIRPFTYDLYAFTATSGTTVSVAVDTVSAATAFDPWACLSTTPEGCVLFDDGVVEWGDDEQPCSFPPPGSWSCPSFSATLPADGTYYLLVSDGAEDAFAGSVGLYALRMGSSSLLGALSLRADNAPDDQTLAATQMAGADTTSFAAPDPPADTLVGDPADQFEALRLGAAPIASPSAPGAGAAGSAAAAGGGARIGKGGGNAAARAARAADETATTAAAGTAAADPGTLPAFVSGGAAHPAENRPPEAVFETQPEADAESVIAGRQSLDVTFDMCRSTDPDAGDELTFSYDLEGNGVVEAGRCRRTHHYELGGDSAQCVSAVVCVGDGTAGHETCRTYAVCGHGSRSRPQ